MAWQLLEPADVGAWALGQQKNFSSLPRSVVFAPVDRQLEAVEALLARRDLAGEIQPRSGTVRLFGDPDRLWADAVSYLEETDLRRSLEEPDESPPEFVRREATTRIEEVPSLGPGGRITHFALAAGEFVDVSVRPVAALVPPGGDWRDPEEVQALANAFVGIAQDYELWGTFGYSEPSAYEAADRADAVYLLRLDSLATNGGPHWRLELEIPADGSLPVDD